MKHEYKDVPDYEYITSAIGNAYFSGVSFPQLWECIFLSETREQLDAAIEITIILNEITKGVKSDGK